MQQIAANLNCGYVKGSIVFDTPCRNNPLTVVMPGFDILNATVCVKFEEKSNKYESDKNCRSKSHISNR